MLDLLVHGQDITVPLGRHRAMPPDAAAVAATRAWAKNWPFRTRRRLHGLQLVATDVPWTAGAGLPVHGPVADLLLLVTGRPVGSATFAGAGVDMLCAQPTSPGGRPAGGGRAARTGGPATAPTRRLGVRA
jgi:hypothetical protein